MVEELTDAHRVGHPGETRRGDAEATDASARPSHPVADATYVVVTDDADAVGALDAVGVIDLSGLGHAEASEALDRLRTPDTVFVVLRTTADGSDGPAVVVAGTFRAVDPSGPVGAPDDADRHAARHEALGDEPAPGGGGSRLSPRETQVLRLAATGRSNREIAEALYLSEYTVLGYLKDISTKLGVHSKLEAVVRAIAEGLIPIPGVDEIGAGRR